MLFGIRTFLVMSSSFVADRPGRDSRDQYRDRTLTAPRVFRAEFGRDPFVLNGPSVVEPELEYVNQYALTAPDVVLCSLSNGRDSRAVDFQVR